MTDFKYVYEEYAGKVYRYLLCLSGSKQAAEELLAETFYQAILHIGQFRGDSSILTWLCGIAGNLWKKEQKRNQRLANTPTEELHLHDTALSPEEAMIRTDDVQRILRAAANLPEQMRLVFLLRVIGDLTLKDIAGIYGKSESWARVTFYRARLKIAEEVLK